MMAGKYHRPLFVALLQTAIALALIAAGGLVLPTAVFPAEAPAQELGADTDKETIEKVAQDAAEKAAAKAAQKAVEKAVEKAVGEAAGKAVTKAAASAAAQAAATAVEQVTKKAAEAEADKAELQSKRPEEWRPTKVEFLIFVLDVDEIDDANQNFTTNVYIQLRWMDERLKIPDGAPRQIPLDEIWNPRLLLANRQGLVSKSLPDVVDVSADGTVTYRQRYTGKLSQPLKLLNFPLDKHTFTIHFVAAGYTTDHLEFVPIASRGVVGGSIADELSLPDWKILKHEALSLPFRPIPEIRTAGFAFRFEAQRFLGYYVWQIIVPLALVVLMSWVAFWVERDNAGARIGVGTSSILSLIAYRFVLANLLPRLPYMTRLDYFTVGSTLLVFVALLAVVWTSYLGTGNKHRALAERIDLSARVLFPAVFILLLGWFILG